MNGDPNHRENTRPESRPVWRVAHAQGIDNLEWFEENEPYNVGAFLLCVFEESPLFFDHNDALAHAQKMASEYDILEYGICSIDRPDMIFFGD